MRFKVCMQHRLSIWVCHCNKPLCVKCRSTWTAKEAGIFHHLCPSNTTWCPALFRHSKYTHTHNSSDQCRCTHQQSHIPTCNIMNPRVTNLTSPSCCFTAGSVIRHPSTALEFALTGVTSVQCCPFIIKPHTQGQQRFIPAGLKSQDQNSRQKSRLRDEYYYFIKSDPQSHAGK